ncbi:hypothetical protein NG895_06245 [Aeoliella sp. ICT_H6.2]|uniref:Uncharacterized protein n=1 Tax=Aeoliella straminimaris TaxID=2954799 RepID=A0A9X2F711_9BACT|nr:hypothetical protein [Aeoliella straminimaris]MCO6043502.1 hypothetical protein [Aeoliella straminimaris]
MAEHFLRLMLIPATVAALYGSWRAMRSIDITRDIAVANMSRPRFQIVDFMALFMMMQIPILLVSAAVHRGIEPTATWWVIWLVYALTYAGIWWWGAAALSSIEIDRSLRRAVFLGLLQPLGIALIVAGGAAVLVAPPVAWGNEPQEAVRAMGGMFVYAVVAVVYSLACDWVRAGSPRLSPQQSAEDENF